MTHPSTDPGDGGGFVEREAAEEFVRSHGAATGARVEIVEAVVARVRPSVRLVASVEPTGGRSRIGGTPDVGDGFEWPRSERGLPLAFVMQVDLAEVHEVGHDGPLPASGLLQVFFEWDRSVPPMEEEWRVTRHAEPSVLSRRAEWPDDLGDEVRFAEFSLMPMLEWTIPLPDEAGLGELPIDDLVFWDEAREGLEAQHGLGPHWTPKHRMLGWADFVQTPGMADDARLLLQVDSDPPNGCEWPTRTGMMWGDCGMIYWITDEAGLAGGDLGAIRPFWECC